MKQQNKEQIKKEKFENCSICGKKIGWLRKLRGDRSCMGMIPTHQFCSNKCYGKALDSMLKKNETTK